MSEPQIINLTHLARHERRVRALWSAEPQRGSWHPADDAARGELADLCARLALDFWMTAPAAALTLPPDLGEFLYAARFFHILGITIAAFPSAELRDQVMAANADAQVVPDGAFWPS